MSTIEKHDKENNNRRLSGISQDSKPSVAASIKTPSKSTRYKLGSASKYYFKYVNSSAKKKKPNNNNNNNNTSMSQENNPNFYLDYMNSATKKKSKKGAYMDEDDTGNLSLLSIPEFTGNNNNSSLDTSVMSLGASSSSSEESDLLNKSTLSDTTELTASNFVLAATSRHKMREIALDDSVWTKKTAAKPVKEPPKPVAEQPPSVRKPFSNKQSTENTAYIRATLSQDSAGTAATATPSARRLSIRGASPSLRSRISASPKSLRKFTEDLKNSRIQRQLQREVDAKKNAAANSALLNSSITSTLDSSLLLDGSELSVTKKKRSRSSIAPRVDKMETSIMSNNSEDSTDDILGAMDELFGLMNSDANNTGTLSQQAKRSSVTARASAVEEALSQESKEENPRRNSIPVAVGFQRSRRSSGVLERPLQLHEKEEASDVAAESPTDQETKASPSKLAPTPQRMQNPRLLDSPARNTRSAKKRLSHVEHDDTESLGDLGDILGGVSDSTSVKASKEGESVIKCSPMEENVPSRHSFGSGEKLELSRESESDSNDETAPLNVIGDLLSQLTQESTESKQDERFAEHGNQGVMKSPGASMSHKDVSLQHETKEGTAPTKLAPTPQRMENPRLLDSPARNTRSAKKRESYSTTTGDAESIADLDSVHGTHDEKPSYNNSNEHQDTLSPATSNLFTQRSIGSEEKADISDGGDATETASLRDLGSIFGELTQKWNDTKQDKDTTKRDMKSPTASVSHKDKSSQQKEAREGATPTKLASTPQRMENPRLLDSPARNTRSAKKRQSYSTSGDVEAIAELDDEPSVAPSNENGHQKSPAIGNLLTQRSIGSEQKADITDGGDATETASLGDLGSIFGELTQESTDSKQDKDTTELGDQGDMKSPEASASYKDKSSQQNETREDATPSKLVPTPQRMKNPRLLDSPARNTRSSAKKRQSYSSSGDAESIVDLDSVLITHEEKPSSNNSNEHQNTRSPANSNMLTQRSIGSEQKADISNGGDATEMASLGDLGSIFGGLTQESTDSKQDKDTTELGDQGDMKSPGASMSHKDVSLRHETKEGTEDATPSKLVPTPQRMVNARLLDSPARNTRSTKKRQSYSTAGDVESIADLGDKPIVAASNENRQQQSPAISSLLTQRSIGSEQKADISEGGDVTDTESLGDLGSIFGGLTQESTDSKQDKNTTEYGDHGDKESPGATHKDKSSHQNEAREDATPSKLVPTPQRMGNARLLDSPARNTRRTKKRQSYSIGDVESSADLGDKPSVAPSNENGHQQSPAISNLLTQRSIGSEEKVDISDGGDATETASIGDLGSIFSGLMEESTDSKQDKDTTEYGDHGDLKSTGATHKDKSSQQNEAREGATLTKLASTPQRMGNARLLDSPARNTRSTKKRQSYSAAGDLESIADLSDKPSTAQSNENGHQQSPAIGNLLTQRSIGSEQKADISDGGDATETASLGDLGSIFGELTQESTDSKQDKDTTKLGGQGDEESRGASVSHNDSSTRQQEAREDATPSKLVPTPQRMGSARLLDSPARNTRSTKKRQSYSAAGDVESSVELDSLLGTHGEKPSVAKRSPAVGNLLTQRSIGSEEKAEISDGGDITETASIGDLGSIFGGFTQTSTDKNSPMAPRQTYLGNDHSPATSERETEKTKAGEMPEEHIDRGGSDAATRVPDHFVDGPRSPDKLAATPQRMEKPRLLDSPARNTRSAKKRQNSSNDQDTRPMGSLGDSDGRPTEAVDGASERKIEESQSPSQDNVISQQSFGSDEKASILDGKEADTETASVGDIRGILGVLPQAPPSKASKSPIHPADSTLLGMKESGFDHLETSNNDDSLMSTSFGDQSEQKPRRNGSFSSPRSELRRDPILEDSSHKKAKESPSKPTSTPQKIGDPRSLDSPSRNTRGAKKQQSQGESEDTSSHTASIADLSDIFGDSMKSLSRDTSMNHDQSSPPSASNDLSQRSFGSAEKADLPEDATNTNTASVGDIRDILSGLSSTTSTGLDSPNQEHNCSMKQMNEVTKQKNLSPTKGNFFSQHSFGSAEKSIKSNGANDGDDTETASIGDIGDIFGGSAERTVDYRSPYHVRLASSAKINSPKTTDRTADSQETELENSFNGSNEKQNASTLGDLNQSHEITASNATVDQSTAPESPPRSPEQGDSLSSFRSRATPTKLAPTPQRIPNPRLFDSPAKNTRSAKKQKNSSNDVDKESTEDMNAILRGATNDTRDDIADKLQEQSPSHSRFRAQRTFGSEEKHTARSKDREEETETASIEDIADILGGPREDTDQSISPKRRNSEAESATTLDDKGKGTDESSSLSISEQPEQNASSDKGSLSHAQRGATPTAKAAETVIFENPRVIDSPARNTRSAKRKLREDDDTTSTSTMANSNVSISSRIPSSESDDGNWSSSQRNPLTRQSFGSEFSRDDENDTRTTASMEEINSILFELAQQAPVEGSPTGELNPIIQNYDESQISSTSQDGTESLNISQVSKESREGSGQLNDSNMSMSLAEEDTSHTSVTTRSGQMSTERTPTKMAQTPEHRMQDAMDDGDIGHGSHSKITSTQKSPMRLTPNSHVKPTPTKIKPSPRRLLNPMSIYSPARNTRSAKKAAKEQSTPKEQSKRKMPPYDSEDLRSPMPKKFKPVGILSSRKRRQKAETGASKRNISFGSPEAALYHVGSPSGSFTPLPRSRAKELFAIPDNNASASSSDDSREETVGIESNLHILVDKITADNMQESPQLSPIANDQESSRIESFNVSGEKSENETEDGNNGNEHTAELEVCMEDLLENAGEGINGENEHTVPLEPVMEQVVANAMHSRAQIPKTDKPLLNASQRSMDTQESSPANSSVDLTDNRSIASMNAQSDKYTSEFKMTAMEAQKLDFSMQTSQIDSDDSMEVEEENTVPLEVDMTSLLAAAGNPSKKQEIAGSNEDTETNESMASPQAPVASTRFSLTKEDSQETIEAVDDLLASEGEDKTTSTENMNESQIGTTESASQEFVNEPYTLTLDELSEIGELKSNNESEASESTSQDSVIKFNSIVEKMDSVAFSRWNQFLKAVCDEVEKQDQDLDGRAAAAYDNILNEQPPNMRKLEAILRSQEGSDTEASIRALVRANKDSVESEWNDWLKNLLEAFSSEWLLALSNDLKKDGLTLDTISELGAQTSAKISAIADEKVRRARRKSLGRRQSLARSLDDEIKELEAQIAQEKTELDGIMEKEATMDAEIVELKEVRKLANEAETLRTTAAPSQKAYMSLRGLHSWNPSSMNDASLAFEAVGQYEQTSTTITYNLEGASIDATVSQDDSNMGTVQYSSKSASAMVDYLSSCVDEHANTVRQKTISSTTEIGPSMQTYMWNLGRTDQTIAELQSLKKRYNTTFSRQGDKFVFSVEFKNSSAALLAEFEIDHLYPALPLEVRLNLIQGDLDLDKVRRSLRKSVKPGFGNLSRACAVISAFVA